jgi:PhoH-like ATPase
MKKIYILDTNVLINDPNSIFQFEDNLLYIPIYVLEELDKLKTEQTLRGRNSRQACRILDEFRVLGNGLGSGVKLNDVGGMLYVYVPKSKSRLVLSVGLDNSYDSSILQSALDIQKANNKKNLKTILVTMDVNLRIRAESLGVQAAPYTSNSINVDELPTGIVEREFSDDDIDRFYKLKGFEISETVGLFCNASVILKGPTKSALGVYDGEKKFLKLLPKQEPILGISPKNTEQRFAFHLLMDKNINLVTINGIAGSGKSLLSTATSLDMVVNKEEYNRLLISRPVIPLGKDIGYLPGSLSEKLDPWMQPIYDNLELLTMGMGKAKRSELAKEKGFEKAKDSSTGKNSMFTHESLIASGIIKVEPLTYIRGRSLPNQVLIVDEAQNLTIHEIKTIITRCGDGTKIILNGDIDQIDSPYIDRSTCGLSIIIDKLHDDPSVAHITLAKGERSRLATLAATRL